MKEEGGERKREKKKAVNLVVGTSDLGLTWETPTGKNSGLIMSMRRSYLQGLYWFLAFLL